jgi:hypothetical protein
MLLVALSIALLASPGTAAARSLGEGPPAIMTVDADRVTWEPQIENGGLVLTISGPCGFDLREEFDPEGPAVFYSEGREDGTYRYELLFLPVGEPGSSPDPTRGLEPDCIDVVTMSGTLTIVNERFVPPEEEEGRGAKAPPPLAAPSDILHYDDVIITGSLCVGFDCQNGESFGFDTIILKEHNLRIYFNDTSYSASYPTNNWRITINSSTNGGGSYFSIDDADEGTSPFRIEAEAPSYSLYVDDYGRVGLGTSSPAAEAHIKDSDTPTVRLEQDGSGGWTPQTWDVAGNESNFFVRDVTNGSKLPFRIIPEAPTNSIYIASDGDVGMGTSSPGYPLEVETTGEGATIVVDRTDGATGKLAAKPDRVQVGTISNHDLHFVRNNSLVGHFDSSGDLWITGVLHESSDVNAKTGIARRAPPGSDGAGLCRGVRAWRERHAHRVAGHEWRGAGGHPGVGGGERRAQGRVRRDGGPAGRAGAIDGRAAVVPGTFAVAAARHRDSRRRPGSGQAALRQGSLTVLSPGYQMMQGPLRGRGPCEPLSLSGFFLPGAPCGPPALVAEYRTEENHTRSTNRKGVGSK